MTPAAGQPKDGRTALVLFSGGQDSTACLALSPGLDAPMVVETPLMWLSKAQTWALTDQLGGPTLTDLVVEHAHTCYLGTRGERHAWGYGCGTCPACALRAAGFQAWVAAC